MLAKSGCLGGVHLNSSEKLMMASTEMRTTQSLTSLQSHDQHPYQL